MAMVPAVSTFVVILITCQIALSADAKPQKAFAKGYTGRNLPPGRWTTWFDSSYPGIVGDFETVENIVQEYGSGCDGLPCRRPLAVKAISHYGLTPSEHRDRVHFHARTGLICRNEEQHDGKCMDYKVRFFCPFSQSHCDEPEEEDIDEEIENNEISESVNELDKKEREMKYAKLRAKQDKEHRSHNEALNYFKTADKIVIEMPEYVKYPVANAPKVILPHIRGRLAQLPDYKDAMTSYLFNEDLETKDSENNDESNDNDVMLSYFKADAPTDMTSDDKMATSEDRRSLMADSAPSVNFRGGSHRINRYYPPRKNSIIYRHFRSHPRAPFS